MSLLSIIVPLKNKADQIVSTLDNLQEITDDNEMVWIVDDYSEDSSYRKVSKYIKSKNISNFQLVKNTGDGGKISAIKLALNKCVDSDYVLLLDADSVIDLRDQSLERLCAVMKEKNQDALAFTVTPLKPKKLIQKQQQIEYTLITDSFRDFIKIVSCVSGAGSIWKTKSLVKILEQHSGVFEGDDLETTMLAYQNNCEIGYLKNIIVLTDTPDHWSKVAIQRLFSWEFGFWRCYLELIFNSWLYKTKTAVTAHYRSIILIDVLLHFFKATTFFILVYYFTRSPVLHVTEVIKIDYFLAKQAYIIWGVLLFIGFISVNMWWEPLSKKVIRKRVNLNFWTLGYISIPFLSLHVAIPFVAWFKRNSKYYDIGQTGLNKYFVDFVHYFVDKTPFFILFFIWWVIVLLFLINIKSIRTQLLALKVPFVSFPAYQMLILAIVRSVSFFIVLPSMLKRAKEFFIKKIRSKTES